MQYEEDFLRYLQSIMADVERRIRRGHQRLSLNAKTKENVSLSCHMTVAIMEELLLTDYNDCFIDVLLLSKSVTQPTIS